MGARQPLAVVTMVYNEPFMLALWERHYHEQVGARHCYILDHGSDDGSTARVASNIVRLPRDEPDDRRRASAVSHFCAALFFSYEAVLYTDVDELVVADPAIASTLTDYARRAERRACVSVFGMDVLHDDRTEPRLDPNAKILRQRRLLRPLEALCKPTFIREPKQWGAGFHAYDGPPAFGGLYLFHMAYVDLGVVFERQVKRNASAPVDGVGDHHRIPPDVMCRHIRELASAEPREVALGDDAATQALMANPDGGLLWLVPERFRDAL